MDFTELFQKSLNDKTIKTSMNNKNKSWKEGESDFYSCHAILLKHPLINNNKKNTRHTKKQQSVAHT